MQAAEPSAAVRQRTCEISVLIERNLDLYAAVAN
jgi:hypothetical protein